MDDLIFKCFLFVKRLFRSGRKIDSLQCVPGGLSPAFGRLLGISPPEAQRARYVEYIASMTSADAVLPALMQYRNHKQELLVRFPELRSTTDHPQAARLRHTNRRISMLEEIMLKAGVADGASNWLNRRPKFKGVIALDKLDDAGIVHDVPYPPIVVEGSK